MGEICGVLSGPATFTNVTIKFGTWDSLNMIGLSCKAYS